MTNSDLGDRTVYDPERDFERLRAAERAGDARLYASLCDSLGINPQDRNDDMYQRGQADNPDRVSSITSVPYVKPTNVDWGSGLGKLVDSALSELSEGRAVQFQVGMRSEQFGDNSWAVTGTYSYKGQTAQEFAGNFDNRADLDREGFGSCVSTLKQFLPGYQAEVSEKVVTISPKRGSEE